MSLLSSVFFEGQKRGEKGGSPYMLRRQLGIEGRARCKKTGDFRQYMMVRDRDVIETGEQR